MKYIEEENLKWWLLPRYYFNYKYFIKKRVRTAYRCERFQTQLNEMSAGIYYFMLFIATLNKYKLCSDKYIWTLHLFLICCKESKLRLPLHTWRGYNILLIKALLNDKRLLHKLFFDWALYEICFSMSLILATELEKIPVSLPKIKEPKLIKLSKSMME